MVGVEGKKRPDDDNYYDKVTAGRGSLLPRASILLLLPVVMGREEPLRQ